MRYGRVLVLPLLLIALMEGNRGAQTAEADVSALEVVQLSQKHYRGIRTLQADFTQIYSAHMARDEEHGILMLKKPRKMYWEYRDPIEKYLVAKGKQAYFYVPRDRQVFVYELDDDRLFLFLMGEGQVARDFEIAFETEELPLQDGNFLIRLTPREEEASFSQILLEIVPTSYQIERLVAIELIGARNDYILKNVQEDVSIPDRRFKFKPPKGVEVVRAY